MAQTSGQQSGAGGLFSQSQQQQSAQQQQGQQVQQSQQPQNMPSQGVSLVERGARTINAALEQEAKYPALDNYISRE
jgi:hypothetical protein